MKSVKAKMDYPASTKYHAATEGCGCYDLMDEKIMLHLLRSKPHKPHLVECLQLRGVTDANAATRWDNFCKMIKAVIKDEKGVVRATDGFLRYKPGLT
jgi:hypothetical protein